MGEAWTVNSEPSCNAYCAHVKAQFHKHGYLTYPAPKIGKDRSLGQNALFHFWITEFICHLVLCHPSQVTEGMKDGTKRTIKGLFYRHYPGEKWMIHEVVCAISQRKKIDYTSSASWKQGEMFMVLEFFQGYAATQGCVLESKGEFARLKREQG